jgi:hypothetical protein
MKRILSIVLALFALAGSSQAVDPDYIPGVTILSAPAPGPLNFNAARILNQTLGVAAEGPNGLGSREMTYINGTGSNVYTGYRIENSLPFPFDVVFDLQTNYTLDEIYIWNFFQNTTVANSGFKDVEISYWADGGQEVLAGDYDFAPYTVPNVTAPASNLLATGDPAGHAAGDPVRLGGVQARYVKFHVKSNHGNAEYRGLSKVRFYRSRVAPGGLQGLPAQLDFGNAQTGSPYFRDVVLTNTNSTSSTPIVINSIDTSTLAPPYTLQEQPASYPFSLAGGASTTLKFRFISGNPGTYPGTTVTVNYTDSLGAQQGIITLQDTTATGGVVSSVGTPWTHYE